MLLFAQILDNCTLLWRQGENVNVQNSCLEKLICCANLERRENSKRYQFSRYDITFSSARCVINFCPQIEHKNFLVLKFQIILYLKAYQNFAFKYISICSCALCDGENNKNGALVKLLRTTSHA